MEIRKNALGCVVVLIVIAAIAHLLSDSTVDPEHAATAPTTPLKKAGAEQRQEDLLTPAERSQPIVAAKAMMAAPGAIVCPDFATVGRAYGRFADYLGDQVLQRSISPEQQRQMKLVNGWSPRPYPDISIYGCALAPAGTRLHVNRSNSVPLVAGALDNGQVIRGVTNPGMIEAIEAETPVGDPPPLEAPSSPSASTFAPKNDVQRSMEEAERLNSQCRGGSGDDTNTLKACDQREAIYQALESQGYCWNSRSTGQNDAWVKCDQ